MQPMNKSRHSWSICLGMRWFDAASMRSLFSAILNDLEQHKDAEPFKHAVDIKAIPLYKKIIRKPMDLSLVRSKIIANKWAHISIE